MRKINNIIIIILIITCYIIGLYNLKHQSLVNFLIDVSVLPIVLLPSVLRKIKLKISDNLELMYLIFIILAYFLGTVLNLYDRIPYYDTLMHFLSGVFEGFIALNICDNKNNITKILFVMGFVSIISICWEIFEFSSSILFKIDPQKVELTGVTDTMKDLLAALLGGMIICIKKLKKS